MCSRGGQDPNNFLVKDEERIKQLQEKGPEEIKKVATERKLCHLCPFIAGSTKEGSFFLLFFLRFFFCPVAGSQNGPGDQFFG